MRRLILIYSVSLALLLLLFQIISYFFYRGRFSLETYIGIFGFTFLVMGLFIGYKVFRKKTGRPVYITAESSAKNGMQVGLSEQEVKVLTLMATGLSNREIADQLFVSVNTIKTHLSNIYAKLDVNRRTQAVQKAKSLEILN